MRIVILTPIPFWHPGTNELLTQLKQNGLEIAVLDIFEGVYLSNELKKEELAPKFLKGIFKKIYNKLLRKRFIRKHIKEGDIIDMHYVNSFYANYLEVFFEKKVKLVATFFGSDFYRPTHKYQYEWQKSILNKCTSIVMGVNMFADFDKVFTGYKDKVFYNQYGSARLDLIKNLVTSSGSFKSKYHIPLESISVTLGYNAKEEQQHLFLLSEIIKLPINIKEKITLLLPLTYGRNDTYLNKLKSSLEASKINYKLFEKYLSDQELAELRYISDITLNAQTTDTLSSSLKEAFIADDVVMVGDWLPYDIYENLGVYFIRSNKDEWTPKMLDLFTRIDKHKKLGDHNGEHIFNFSSWSVLIKDWISFYKNL